MWVVIVKSQRSEWINWMTIGRTRAESRRLYRETWLPKYYSRVDANLKSGKARLAKVVISEEAA